MKQGCEASDNISWLTTGYTGLFETAVGLKRLKKKFALYTPWRPLGLREVETPKLSDIRFTDGSNVVSPTSRSRFTHRKIPVRG
jgi:hypothetical protein